MKKKYNISVSRLFNPSPRILLQCKTIKNNIINNKGNLIMITHITNKQKRSELSVNLAVDIALDGYKVLIIDADFQNKLLTNIFTKKTNKGFLDAIFCSESCINEYVQKSNLDNLYFLPIGNLRKEIRFIYTDKKLENFIDIVKKSFDFIFVDASSVLYSSETQTLITKADSCILAIDKVKTSKNEIEEVVEFLLGMKEVELGTVLLD